MLKRGRTTIDSFQAPLRDLLNRRQFPEVPLAESQIEMLLGLLSSMDTDKDPEAARVGEREARVATPLLTKLSGGFNHGIGRSGQLSAPQPKAVGASLMQRLANDVATDAIRKLGLSNVQHGLVVPLSTGMTIGLVLSGLKRELSIQSVLYPRIDHKSPHRGIQLCGLEEISTGTTLKGDAVTADLEDLSEKAKICDHCAILATTTFFAPRESDPVKEIARLAGDLDIPFIINNAYGVQSESVMASVRSAIDAGRVDAVVQSSDKNFLSPVGGSVVVSPSRESIQRTSDTFAGRATAAPVVQTLVALLALGLDGYRSLREEQKENRRLLESKLVEIASNCGQRVLSVDNPVSVAMTLDRLDAAEIGSRLYHARVTGPRAVPAGAYGSCIDNYPHPYIVMNAAIGASKKHVEKATTKLYKEVQS